MTRHFRVKLAGFMYLKIFSLEIKWPILTRKRRFRRSINQPFVTAASLSSFTRRRATGTWWATTLQSSSSGILYSSPASFTPRREIRSPILRSSTSKFFKLSCALTALIKWALLGLFLSFSHHTSRILNDKRIGGVFWTPTWDGMMKGADKSIVIWRQPLKVRFKLEDNVGR